MILRFSHWSNQLDLYSSYQNISAFAADVIDSFISNILMSTHSVQDYWILSVIGKGTYAKVLLIRSKQDKQVYAMKVLKKKYIIEKNQ